MAFTMATADNILKSVYLDVVANQINTTTSAFYNKIEKTTRDVVGKEVIKSAPFGVNGGFAAGSETAALPIAGENQYAQFKSGTKDLFGVIEITDKLIKASGSNVGAFVDALQSETQGLLDAAKYNLSRMLHTDGTGKLATCGAASTVTDIPVDTVKYLIEGLTIDICDNVGAVKTAGRRILAIDRTAGALKVKISGTAITTLATDIITIQSSYNKELTGLAKVYAASGTLYGLDKGTYYWLKPYIQGTTGAISDVKIQQVIDYISEVAGGQVDYLQCSYDVRRFYLNYLETTKRVNDTLDLGGGFKAISYSGIPLVAERFVPDGTIDFLNTKDFHLHQMGDWDFIGDESGKILKQVPGYAKFTATLAKYAELICDKPIGQGRATGITA